MGCKLSIITINYNNREGLSKTFNSIAIQTWRDFEYIVIDGGSTDGGRELIENNPNVHYWISEKDTGVYNAMNKGIKQSSGEYLIFMNSGDFFYDATVLEKIKKNFELNIDILYGNSLFFNSSGYHKVIRPPQKLSFSFFYNDVINHQAAFIKRSLFYDHFFYNENYKICADWEFFIVVICLYNASYQYMDEIICYYDYSGISADPKNRSLYEKERGITIKKYFAAFSEDLYLSKEASIKRIQQVLYIKKYPMAWRIFKWIISIFLLFLPKFRLKY